MLRAGSPGKSWPGSSALPLLDPRPGIPGPGRPGSCCISVSGTRPPSSCCSPVWHEKRAAVSARRPLASVTYCRAVLGVSGRSRRAARTRLRATSHRRSGAMRSPTWTGCHPTTPNCSRLLGTPRSTGRQWEPAGSLCCWPGTKDATRRVPFSGNGWTGLGYELTLPPRRSARWLLVPGTGWRCLTSRPDLRPAAGGFARRVCGGGGPGPARSSCRQGTQRSPGSRAARRDCRAAARCEAPLGPEGRPRSLRGAPGQSAAVKPPPSGLLGPLASEHFSRPGQWECLLP